MNEQINEPVNWQNYQNTFYSMPQVSGELEVYNQGSRQTEADIAISLQQREAEL